MFIYLDIDDICICTGPDLGKKLDEAGILALKRPGEAGFRRAPRAKTPPHLDGASPHLNFPPASPPASPGRFATKIPASSNFFPKSGPVYV